jgi:hypothetical protein
VTRFKNTKLRVESLESRQMMAGDVTAYLSAGNLYLTEAAGQIGQENSVIISQLPGGQIRVEGNAQISNDSATSLVNGHAYQDFTVPGGLFVNFGGGNDRVIFGADPAAAPHFSNVSINVAAPELVVKARTVSGVTNTALKGPDADQVFVWNAVTTGSMTINTGRDHDWISMGINTSEGVLNIGQDLVINSGAGADTVNIFTNQHLGAGGKLDIQAYSSLNETDADQVWLSNFVANGDINVRTGGGNDLVHLNNCTAFHDLNISAGAGNDTAELIGDLAVDKVMADLGDGNDTLNVDTLYYSNYANVTLTGGNGSDNLNWKNINPTHFSHFQKTGWERINGRLTLLTGISATNVNRVMKA